VVHSSAFLLVLDAHGDVLALASCASYPHVCADNHALVVFWFVARAVLCVDNHPLPLGVVAWILERRVRWAETDLREIEDPDVVSRWGQVSQLSGFRSLSGVQGEGLTPTEIKELPCSIIPPKDEECDCSESCECAICITDMKSGDTMRLLPNCGHSFHKSCIDLWLLRRSDCPLCKRSVRKEVIL